MWDKYELLSRTHIKEIDIPALSNQVRTSSSFTVSVLTTWARLLGLKSPERELTVTSLRSMLARTVVKRTLQSL